MKTHHLSLVEFTEQGLSGTLAGCRGFVETDGGGTVVATFDDDGCEFNSGGAAYEVVEHLGEFDPSDDTAFWELVWSVNPNASKLEASKLKGMRPWKLREE